MKKENNRHIGRQKTAVLAAILSAAAVLTACGSKTYLKDIKASDYVTLGDYKGIEVNEEKTEINDTLVNDYLEAYLLPSFVTVDEVTGRPVQEGDTVNIDYAGYLDGEQFDGGTASGQNLTIGSHRFIDGFEDGLIGANVGDTLSLELSFPDPYPNDPSLAGKPVVFEVTVNSIGIQKLPELNDEFAVTAGEAMGIEDCTTVQDLKDYLKERFAEQEELRFETAVENSLTNRIMANCTFKEPPAEMVERFLQNITDVQTAQAQTQGMTLPDYMQNYYGMDEAAYKEQFQSNALTGAQQYIMYQAIADIEGLDPTEEQIQEEIDSRVEAYGYESEEEYLENVDVEMLKEQTMRDNVMAFLKENNTITATTEIVD